MLVIFQLLINMIASVTILTNEYYQAVKKGQYLIQEASYFNEQCLQQFIKRDSMDLCNEFIDYDEIIVSDYTYVYNYDSSNQVISVKKR